MTFWSSLEVRLLKMVRNLTLMPVRLILVTVNRFLVGTGPVVKGIRRVPSFTFLAVLPKFRQIVVSVLRPFLPF